MRARHERTLVVLAGLPGAGKTTMLRLLSLTSAALALDAEDVARALAGVPLPYRSLRPVVHTAHLVRVVGAAMSAGPCILATDPMTSALRRLLMRAAAAISGRRLVVVVVHATPAEARDGQRRRGRTLGERRMRRHEQRYARLRDVADAVISRQEAASARTLMDVLRRGGTADSAASTPVRAV